MNTIRNEISGARLIVNKNIQVPDKRPRRHAAAVVSGGFIGTAQVKDVDFVGNDGFVVTLEGGRQFRLLNVAGRTYCQEVRRIK